MRPDERLRAEVAAVEDSPALQLIMANTIIVVRANLAAVLAEHGRYRAALEEIVASRSMLRLKDIARRALEGS